MKKNIKKSVIIGMALSFSAFSQASEDLAVVGSWSGLPLHKTLEAPFWEKTLPNASNGNINVSLTTHDQMGLGVGDIYRMLGDGLFDVGMTVADYAVSDAPELEGLDVPLIALTAEDAHTMVKAATPMVEDIFNNRFNSHVLAIAPYPPQVVFCNKPIENLADLKELKVRASGRMTAKFIEALGAEGVNVSFSEVPGALQKGVVDCAITGAGSGYSAGWWEVSSHLLTLPLGGWDPVVTAINLDKWNSLSVETQELMQAQIDESFTKPAWEGAQDSFANDIACLTGNAECPLGEARSMVLIEATDEDFKNARMILETQVLPDWADRAGADWVKRWNESVGDALGFQIVSQ